MSSHRRLVALLTMACLPAVDGVRADPSAEALLKLHTGEARAYQIFRDKEHQQALELQTKPIFTWTNLAAEHPQIGHVYVWTFAGRPEVVGTIFSLQGFEPAKRALVHEFHTLSTQQLFPVTPEYSAYQWKPQRGITLDRVAEAPAVAEMAAGRLLEMRRVARSFTAETRSGDGQQWELRLLPTPALRYEPKSGEVLDGALFALVSSAGTDPEVLLQIEARHPSDTDSHWAWYAAAVRFSDRDVTVKRDGKLIWSSLTDPSRRVSINSDFTLIQTPDKTYSCYRSREVDELPEGAVH